MTKSPWLIAVDTGGTFTDCLAIDPEGNLHTRKILSRSCLRGTLKKRIGPKEWSIEESWNAPANFPVGFTLQFLRNSSHQDFKTTVISFDATNSVLVLDRELPEGKFEGQDVELLSHMEAPSLAARLITNTPANNPLPPLIMRLGTTKGTNALLEGKGIPPVLIITKGFGDLLQIGNQTRPDLFALEILRPKPLYGKVIEVNERLRADGSVLIPLNVQEFEAALESLSAEDKQCAAVAFLHSDLNGTQEGQVKSLLQHSGFARVSCSSEIAPFVRLLDRAQTTVINAYLAPVIEEYVNKVECETGAMPLLMMTSAGGLLKSTSFKPKDSLLSGPAGGIVGASQEARLAGYLHAISFDMGGTSTDVSRYAEGLPYVSEHQVGSATLLAPALDIHTVAAGGGSICSVEQGHLRVGPQSAGSTPGPACYGAGGPLTITDVNLLLGRLIPSSFEIPLSFADAERKATELITSAHKQFRGNLSDEAVLDGFLALANQAMADAIRRISVQKGYSLNDFVLVSFGGAGGQHACAIADLLGINRIIVPRHASLLSAAGILNAPLERMIQQEYMQLLDEFNLHTSLIELQQRGITALAQEGFKAERCSTVKAFLDLRLQGQEDFLSLLISTEQSETPPQLEEQFAKLFKQRYGYTPPDRPLQVVKLRVVVRVNDEPGKPKTRRKKSLSSVDAETIKPREEQLVFTNGTWIKAPIYFGLREHQRAIGPCLISALQTVIWVEAGWTAKINRHEQIIMYRTKA